MLVHVDHSKPSLLLSSRDDNGDFIAARGYCGGCGLAYQLGATTGPPAGLLTLTEKSFAPFDTRKLLSINPSKL